MSESEDVELREKWREAPRDPIFAFGARIETAALGKRVVFYDRDHGDRWISGRPLHPYDWV